MYFYVRLRNYIKTHKRKIIVRLHSGSKIFVILAHLQGFFSMLC
nr:MAG TPA: hypothetical protein [Caudoviricetes sp.]